MAEVAVPGRRHGDLPRPPAEVRRLVPPQGQAEARGGRPGGALREVLEETGHHCAPGARLGTVSYLANGRPKQVVYWAAEATDGEFAANDEVDRILWLPPPTARDRLTQPRDRLLIDALLDSLPSA